MNARHFSRRTWHLAPLVLIAAAGLAQAQAPAPAGSDTPSTTDAEGYKVLIPSATLANSRLQEANVRRIVLNVLRGNEPLNANQVVFDAFFAKFYFPMRTQTTPENLADLPAERHRFFRDFMEICAVPAVHEHFCDMTLAQMKMIVNDNFHPQVRYNAMLIISSLNDAEKVLIGATKGTPEPMLRALPVILDEFNKPENTDAIRAAAMYGLVRHLEWDNFKSGTGTPIPPPQKAEVIKTLLALAESKTPPAGRNAAGHDWFRRRAIEGLAHAGYTAVTPPVAAAIERLVKDDKESLSVRCAAAAAVGQITYQAPATLDVKAMARELGYLALVACDHELSRVANMRKIEDERGARLSGELAAMAGKDGGGGPIAPRPPTGGRPPMIGGDGLLGGGGNLLAEDPKQYRFDYVRRRIRADLYSVQVGLTGGEDKVQTTRGVEKVAKTPADRQYVNDVKAAVEKLALTLESAGGLELASLDQNLRSQMKALEGMTRKLGEVAAPPAGPEVPPPAGIPMPVAAPMPPPAVPAPPPAVPAPPPAVSAPAAPAPVGR